MISIEPNEILNTEHIVPPTEMELLLQEFNLLFELNDETTEHSITSASSVSQEEILEENVIPEENANTNLSTPTIETNNNAIDVLTDDRIIFSIDDNGMLNINKRTNLSSENKQFDLYLYCNSPFILGNIKINENEFVLFLEGLYNEIKISQIVLYMYDENQIILLQESSRSNSLNLHKNFPITGTVKNIENSSIIFWTDNLNFPRIMDIDFTVNMDIDIRLREQLYFNITDLDEILNISDEESMQDIIDRYFPVVKDYYMELFPDTTTEEIRPTIQEPTQEPITIRIIDSGSTEEEPIENRLSFSVKNINRLLVRKQNVSRDTIHLCSLEDICDHFYIIKIVAESPYQSLLFIETVKDGIRGSSILLYNFPNNSYREIISSQETDSEEDFLSIRYGNPITACYKINYQQGEGYLCWRDSHHGNRILVINPIEPSINPLFPVNIIYPNNYDVETTFPTLSQLEIAWETWIEQNNIPEPNATDNDIPSIDEFREIEGVDQQYNFEQTIVDHQNLPENKEFYEKVLEKKDDFSIWAEQNGFGNKVYVSTEPNSMTIIYYKVINENYFLIGRKINFYINRFVTDYATVPIEKYFIQDAIFWKYKIKNYLKNGEFNISFNNDETFTRSLPHSKVQDFSRISTMIMCFGESQELSKDIKTDSLSELIESMYLITESRLPFRNDQHVAYTPIERSNIISQLDAKPITLFNEDVIHDFVTPFVVKTEMDEDILNPEIDIEINKFEYKKRLNEFLEMNKYIKKISCERRDKKRKKSYRLTITLINNEIRKITMNNLDQILTPTHIGYNRLNALKVQTFIIPYLELVIKSIRPSENITQNVTQDV